MNLNYLKSEIPCNKECDVHLACHPAGWTENEKNIYLWYQNFLNIPPRYFQNSSEYQLLKRDVQTCFERRQACEICKRKKIKNMDDDPERFTKQDTPEGHWWSVVEGRHGDPELDTFYTHTAERDKAKILMNVMIYKWL